MSNNIVYFSSITENTKRFVEKLPFKSYRIPLKAKDSFLYMDEKFVLIIPTYGGGDNRGAVPKQVIKFLNNENNRSLCEGVIAAGNVNFGLGYCIAGDIVSHKLQVPFLYKFELAGTPYDVERVTDGLKKFWSDQSLN